jgi:antitoxin VapB
MEHAVHIESEDAVAMASELAKLTGESITEAVVSAIRERLERLREREAKIQRILATGREIAAHMEPGTTSDHSWLYDENGLPK